MRERGFRITRQRDAILDYLLSTEEHPSARRVWEKVRERVPGVSLSSVYGTLSELKTQNIIREIEFDEMENRYEGNLDHHINLICVHCGKITDYETARILDSKRIQQTARFQVIQSRFELYGVCEVCSK
jgi:Fur family transcriptional regulator, peroxide stress response regulator